MLGIYSYCNMLQCNIICARVDLQNNCAHLWGRGATAAPLALAPAGGCAPQHPNTQRRSSVARSGSRAPGRRQMNAPAPGSTNPRRVHITPPECHKKRRRPRAGLTTSTPTSNPPPGVYFSIARAYPAHPLCPHFYTRGVKNWVWALCELLFGALLGCIFGLVLVKKWYNLARKHQRLQ